VLGNLKTALAGTYHAFDFEKYAHRYLAEVQYLFNRRYDLRSSSSGWLAPPVGPSRAPSGTSARLRFIADPVF
jgi:hypothetical protein